jgi:hypothetical protein
LCLGKKFKEDDIDPELGVIKSLYNTDYQKSLMDAQLYSTYLEMAELLTAKQRELLECKHRLELAEFSTKALEEKVINLKRAVAEWEGFKSVVEDRFESFLEEMRKTVKAFKNAEDTYNTTMNEILSMPVIPEPDLSAFSDPPMLQRLNIASPEDLNLKELLNKMKSKIESLESEVDRLETVIEDAQKNSNRSPSNGMVSSRAISVGKRENKSNFGDNPGQSKFIKISGGNKKGLKALQPQQAGDDNNNSDNNNLNSEKDNPDVPRQTQSKRHIPVKSLRKIEFMSAPNDPQNLKLTDRDMEESVQNLDSPKLDIANKLILSPTEKRSGTHKQMPIDEIDIPTPQYSTTTKMAYPKEDSKVELQKKIKDSLANPIEAVTKCQAEIVSLFNKIEQDFVTVSNFSISSNKW